MRGQNKNTSIHQTTAPKLETSAADISRKWQLLEKLKHDYLPRSVGLLEFASD
jgi:hypothetical protein